MMFDAKWYSLLHTGNDFDVEYYVNITKEATSVLELGSGAGRITFPIAKGGVSIVGVDKASGMGDLAAAEAEKLDADTRGRVQFVRGDMRTVRLDQRFDKVIIPYNGLLCMLSDNDVRSVFETAARHLVPNGELIFDIYYVPDDLLESREPADGADEYEHLVSISTDDAPVHVLERFVPNADPRRFDTAYRYQTDTERGAEIIAEYCIPQRCILMDELVELLYAAGFSLSSITGDFMDLPITEDTGQLVVRARLRSGIS